MKRIAINGFGRIGRLLCRMISKDSNYELVVINDLATPKILAHLLKYDTIHGHFIGNVNHSDESLFINQNKISVLNIKDLENLSWKDYDIDILFECTGKYKTKKELSCHIELGAKKVILCCPPSSKDIPMVVLGVNDNILQKKHDIISNASCTTNCAAPMIKVLDDELKLKSAYVTTVHSYTSDQNLHDGIHADLRRARSATNSIIPTTTGAAKALTNIFPHLDLGGCGIRVPVSNCSLIDITCFVNNKISISDVNSLFKDYSAKQTYNVLKYNTDPIVSIDVKASSFSCVYDSELTYSANNMIKIVGWYDNESGYCSRLIDLINIV
ncbi:MAG: type I glyceraldehyde-3-phosphate dehydrogenase [Flavobacteriales bacterium]|nr:type I glyceraldehyde-3-phosphate dehydrogenase [Flavobacteriales bacterium]|tara:strand:- start:4494 stop:5474 length:981 start_codon:yes stop_codon:yes gene_type:complete